MSTQNSIKKLQAWYASNCDGHWEHTYGFDLITLDKPGWSIKVNLEETHQENQEFTERKINYGHDSEWLIVSKKEALLMGACGPAELEAMLIIVTEWLQPRRG